MTDRPAIPPHILESRVIAIGRRLPAAGAPRVGAALVAGGVPAMELTLNEPRQSPWRPSRRWPVSLTTLAPWSAPGRSSPSRPRGARSRRALASSSRRTATASWWRGALRRPCPASPAPFRRRKILAAWSAGASAVKLFPAAAVGPAYLAQIADRSRTSPSCLPAASRPRRPATGSPRARWRWAWAAGSSATASRPASPTRARLVRAAIDRATVSGAEAAA